MPISRTEALIRVYCLQNANANPAVVQSSWSVREKGKTYSSLFLPHVELKALKCSMLESRSNSLLGACFSLLPLGRDYGARMDILAGVVPPPKVNQEGNIA